MKAVMAAVVALAGMAFGPIEVGSAATKPDKPDCMQTAMTQYEMDKCANEQEKAADTQLNTSYRSALCYVDADQKSAFVAAQRAWIAFRDADCRVWGGGGGTIAPMNQALCVASLSIQRAKELDEWPPNASRDAFVSNCHK